MRGMNALLRLPRALMISLVRGYRLLLSPSIGQSCRFTPTCSVYAIAALERHGAVVGSGLAAWRIVRCNPLCQGGCDPVPDNMPWQRAQAGSLPPSATGLFTGLLHPEFPREPGAAATTASSPPAASADPTLSKTPS